ncbi:MAG: hypothetical protein HPY75_13995 [Actinobacteria bacterium]|nr:hypothetical protein [Actinomycetota bacterium]
MDAVNKRKPILSRSRWKWLLVSAIAAGIAIGCTLVFLPDSGKATGKQDKDRLRTLALANSRELIPEARTAEEMPEYESNEGITMALKDESGNTVSVVMIDRITGELEAMFDFREESNNGLSPNVNINRNEAETIAENFLKEKGVDVSQYGLEADPLRIVAMDTSDVEKPKEVYRYEFNYRIQRDGIFIDDFEYGGGYCAVHVSPDNGQVVYFLLPRDTLQMAGKSAGVMRVEKKQALDIAVNEANLTIDKEIAIPRIDYEKTQLRYMNTSGDELIPYWRIEYGFEAVDRDRYSGACYTVLGISAVDGTVILRYEY